MTATTLNLHQRLALVRKEVPYIKKEKAVEGYRAVSHDQVTRETRQWFIAHGISIVVNLVSAETKDTGTKTKNGTPLIRYESVFDVTFVNVDNPVDRETYRVGAHANDHGDKAPGKAVSYAVKSVVLKALNIETGENDESRGTGAEVEAERIVEIENMMDAAADLGALRKTLEMALAEAKDLHDHYANKRFRKYAETRAAKFNEFMPKDTGTAPAPQTAEEPKVVKDVDTSTGEIIETPPTNSGPPATEGAVKSIKSAMLRSEKTEHQMIVKFGCDFSNMPKAKVSEILAWAKS